MFPCSCSEEKQYRSYFDQEFTIFIYSPLYRHAHAYDVTFKILQNIKQDKISDIKFRPNLWKIWLDNFLMAEKIFCLEKMNWHNGPFCMCVLIEDVYLCWQAVGLKKANSKHNILSTRNLDITQHIRELNAWTIIRSEKYLILDLQCKNCYSKYEFSAIYCSCNTSITRVQRSV